MNGIPQDIEGGIKFEDLIPFFMYFVENNKNQN